MLPKKNRIPTTYFSSRPKGKVLESEFFRVVINPLGQIKEPQFAVIVSQKIAKTSVVRNRLRRQIYALLEEFKDKITPSLVFITPKKQEIDNQVLKDDLINLLCLKK